MTAMCKESAAKHEHNQDVPLIWQAYHSGNPVRVPVHFNLDERFFVLTPEINKAGITWEELCTDPAKVIVHRLQVQRWWRDVEAPFMDVEFPEGEPDAWEGCTPYFESAHEAAVFGASLWFAPGQNPDVYPIFKDDKRRFCPTVLPDIDPLGDNVVGRSYQQVLRVREMSEKLLWEGKPLKQPGFPWRWFTGDGPFTVGVKLRGGTELCLDIYDDPAYVHELLGYITDSIIHRCKTLQSFARREAPDLEPTANFGVVSRYWAFSDDSAAMLSEKDYREFVLPYNKRIRDAFCSPDEPIHVHMCGQAQHLFETMVTELNARSFDVGYPTDMALMRKILGPEVAFTGNIHPMILKDGPISLIQQAVKEVMASGVMEGGRFVLRDGSNVPPGTPIEHLRACYETAKEYGRYV